METLIDLKERIRDIPDFPQKGILFRDITTLLQDGSAFRYAVDRLVDQFRGTEATHVAAVEARGYIFGAPLAHALNLGFVPVRKPGKLPSETLREEYELEYGKNILEIHNDALKAGDKVIVVDDLIATGGSARATARLVEKLGARVVGFCFLIELTFLNGRQALDGYEVFSLITY
ncbi:MAG TPA: adenine phosphoribosyltransferase [Candidatus Nitrosotenuis sp.]|jgi:adenine phosphoribosyltransferase|nr:adenine phosphoribosyltransferase [Candidatus Nitrosotenuis sp.]